MDVADTTSMSTIPRTPAIVTRRDELRAAVAAAKRQGRSIGVVPTMGGLHAGHLSLVDAACRECDFTIVTIFVNPTQFAPGEDFEKYPRDLEADLRSLSVHPVNLVFAPADGEMYRPGHATYVEMGGLAKVWEGACRPTHFRGVATIVLKLLNMTAPDVAYFGQKDYQQSLLVRRMVDDLDLDVNIRVCPIVRDADGLALSSRNVYLGKDARRRALALSASLALAARLVEEGRRQADPIRAEIERLLSETPGVRVQYVAIVDPETMQEVDRISGRTLVAVAAVVDGTRLIDNRLIGDEAPAAGSLSPA